MMLKNFLNISRRFLTTVGTPKRTPVVVLTPRQRCDIEMIMNGGFAPLNGFMKENDYKNCVERGRLTDGTLWPMPIVLDVREDSVKVDEGEEVELQDQEGNPIARMIVESIFRYDLPYKMWESHQVFGGDKEHPYIQELMHDRGNYCIGGQLEGIQNPPHYNYADLRLGPDEVKKEFADRDWDKVIAFQTRNPLHRAHYELTVQAAKEVGAKIWINPVVGMTKPGDIDAATRVRCYREIMPRYGGEAFLSVLPLAMRMGGPREALWHALIRQNYGATHFILGRDHAGPGANSQGKDFYGPYEARDYALEFQDELDIQLVPFEMMVYTEEDKSYHPIGRVPEGYEPKKLSGTEVRRRLGTGEEIPEWFSFPEVVRILRKSYRPADCQGYCIFFTGFSGSGKTTIANALVERLMELDEERMITVLDGDYVRQMLSSELGFSRKDRELNVKRIGYVAGQVVKHGGVAIAAPIAPYNTSREFARSEVESGENRGQFILVHVNTTIEECERRDRKGLYAKARAGELNGLTGIDDPYEVPMKPDLEIDTEVISVDMAISMIETVLKRRGLIRKDVES